MISKNKFSFDCKECEENEEFETEENKVVINYMKIINISNALFLQNILECEFNLVD